MRSTILRYEAIRLFLLSFLILFLELVCIRWLSSYILYLGYFTNFVLLGCLLGMGAGTLLANRKVHLINGLPILLFVFLTAILFLRAQVNTQFKDFIYFSTNVATLRLPAYILLPLIFIAVTAIFTFLSQDLGVLLTRFAPLKSYNLNILGSLAGILCFTLLGLLALPSWVWFLVAVFLLIPLLPSGRSFIMNIFLLAGLIVVIAVSDFAFANIWSPYYRLNILDIHDKSVQRVNPGSLGTDSDRFLLLANGIGHQEFISLEKSPLFYLMPYTAFSNKPDYQNALVIGAGGGNDVAFALANGVQKVDAVEIDPRIAVLGKEFHPEQPYNDPRVTLYIDDARSFLHKTQTHYDLVIFALPDSLVLAASTSNIRLESYLFTLECFQSVKEHLQPNGLFVLYNYYRYDWLINKIDNMLFQVFNESPINHRYIGVNSEDTLFATIYAGPKAKEIDISQPGFSKTTGETFQPATDNWPFLYLKNPSLPVFYSAILVIILLFSLILIIKIAPKGAINRHGWPFLFMGAAFTLLEAKSIVNFLLLFGSTWLVNSLVFFAILLVVLLANILAARFRFSRVWLLYALLFLSLAINFAIPLKVFLVPNLLIRYVLATVFLFSPIFFANLIYSTTFRDTQMVNVAFGANLLGSIIGGASEYLSLLIGYRALVLIAGIFYILAFAAFRRMKRVNIPMG